MGRTGIITPILLLSSSNFEGVNQPYFAERFQFDVDDAYNKGVIDNFFGFMTSSYSTVLIFQPAGTSFDMNNTTWQGAPEFFANHQIAYTDKIITEVVAWARTSGSGGVTTVDVQIQQGSVQPANFSSIFASNATRPAISSSLGNFGLARSSTFVSGTMVWASGTMLRARLLTGAGGSLASGNEQWVPTVQVFWKPSGTWGI